ncbi:MAG: FkbM family methyltransferase [Candidatus Competibacter denitrificans]
MGVGYQGLQFSLFGKGKGVSFDRTVMLGRQNHYLDAGTLHSMFERFGSPVTDAEVHTMLHHAYSENLFKQLGATKVDSIDASGYEGASIIHNLNDPIPVELQRQYTCVVDFGSLEHVFNFPGALKNATDLLADGGHLLSITTANNFMGHGFYQFAPEAFFGYLAKNGFTDIEIYMILYRNLPYWFRVSEPRQIGNRVELVNGEPVQMGILARKVEHRPQAAFPIQSDYHDAFWQRRDVDRKTEAPPVDPHVSALVQDLKTKIAALVAWPEMLSPHLTNGFENHLHYQLIDPAVAVAGVAHAKAGPALLSRLQKALGISTDTTTKPSAPPPIDKEPTHLTPVEEVEHRGVIIPIIPKVFSEQIIQAIRVGTYEASEAGELDALIQTDEVILEIGAGCGFISTYCAKNPHTKAVYSVEANPALIDVIRLTHKLNNVQVTLYHEVLAKESGEIDFYVHEDFWASGTHSFLGKPVKVKTTSFQQRLAEIRPTMLIVDIEGGEDGLFEGIDLTGVRKIMLEVHQPTIGRRGVKRLFDQLSAQNFHYDMWHSSRSIVTFSHVDRG